MGSAASAAATAPAAASTSHDSPPILNAVKYAGRLSLFYRRWSQITDDHTILSWIKGYKIKFSSPVVQDTVPVPRAYTDSERIQLIEAIDNLLQIGAVSECKPCCGQYLSSFFLTPKSNGKMRFILNLKNLNRFISPDHFKLEDLRTALKLTSKDCYLATLDLKDAYFLIKIHNESKKYLRFAFNDKIYQFNVLPFGLSTAPFIFTKIMKPVAKYLRSTGLLSTLYLDDWLLLGQSYQDCLTNIETTKELLISLGFIVNEEKSVLVPSQSCKFLGMIINSSNMTLSLPNEKRIRIHSELEEFTKLNRCKIRKYAQLVGLLVSACPAVEYGWLYTKELERCKFLNLQDHNDYDRLMNIPNSVLPDIQWWMDNINHSVHRIRDDDYVKEIYSDASTTGWGACCNNNTASGQWSASEQEQHINFLELLAAFIGLKIFAKDLYDCQILLRIDNTTAISYINRMGGIQFPHLTGITRDIWQWCEGRKLYIFASYIRSCDNVVADAESRKTHPDIEFELTDWAFQRLTTEYGLPEIDLFASRLNNKCTNYVSWHRDPDALAINAFTLCWSNYYFYAFPPFSMILKTLRKIIADKARGIMIVPLWPTQPWYPLFTSLLVSKTVSFLPNDNALSFHSSSQRIHSSLTLVAGVLSGRR